MPAITPLLYFSNTPASTTATSEADLDRKMGTALADGVEYLVFYYANCGGNDTSAIPEIALRFGATGSLTSGTRLARALAEGRGLDEHWNSAQLQGFTLVTGDGSSVLGFTGFTTTSSDEAFFGAFAIVCIPTTDLPADTLYFDGTDSESDEVTAADTAGETLRSFAPTGMPAADYLVMGCAEVETNSDSTAAGYTFNMDIDSSTNVMDASAQEECENAADRMTVNCAGVFSLGAGTHTFRITCGSQGANLCDWSRSRILALNLDSFDQYVNTLRTTALATTATSFGTDSMCAFEYTPAQTEYVLLIGSIISQTNTTRACAVQIQNTDDATVFCQNANEFPNHNDEDFIYCVPLACEQISAAKDYRIDVRTDAGTGTFGPGDADSRLIAISLFVPETGTTVAPGSASLAISEQAPSLRETLTPTAAALAISEQAPSLALAVKPAAAALVISEETPAVQTGDDVILNPANAALAIAGQAPDVLAPVDLFPNAAALAISEQAPSLAYGYVVPAAALVISEQTPLVPVATNVTPASQALAITERTPTLAEAVAAPAAVLTITGRVPIIGRNLTPSPPSGPLTITEHAPTLDGFSIWNPDGPFDTDWIEVSDEGDDPAWTPPSFPDAPAWAGDSALGTRWQELRAERSWEIAKLDATHIEDWDDVDIADMTGGPPRTAWESGRESP